jgi:hypothetical protein
MVLQPLLYCNLNIVSFETDKSERAKVVTLCIHFRIVINCGVHIYSLFACVPLARPAAGFSGGSQATSL